MGCRAYLFLSTLLIRLVKPSVIRLSKVYHIDVRFVDRLYITLTRINPYGNCTINSSNSDAISWLNTINLNLRKVRFKVTIGKR